MDITFKEWSAALVGKDGKWGNHYDDLTPEQKHFYRCSMKAYQSGQYKDILDYKEFCDHKVVYKFKHFFKRGGNE